MRRTLGTAAVAAALALVPGGAGAFPHPEAPDCSIFPASNPWNRRVDRLPVLPNSATLIRSIGLDRTVHADFGSGEWDGGPIGIPITFVGSSQPPVPVRFEYEDESDPGPYPIPPDVEIEGGPDSDGDRHAIVVDRDRCVLHELFALYPDGGGQWRAGSGAIWSLRSNKLRPKGWTSADAAGLPILPGLARYDEVARGKIDHALRFTAPQTRRKFVYPARHFASNSSDPALPPMGTRVRLRADFDTSSFPPQARVVLEALKLYGMLLADNGSPWFITGEPDERWDNDQLHTLGRVKGSDFEAVDARSLRP
jgi:hypothetical protein